MNIKNSLMTPTDNMSRQLAKVSLQLQNHKSEIYLGVGITLGIASTVMACVATTKMPKVIEDSKAKMEDIHEKSATSDGNEAYPIADQRKDTARVAAETAIDVLKLYAPAAIAGAASISCVLVSHKIMRERVASLGAAYAALDTANRAYRERVRERYGDEVDSALASGETRETVIEQNEAGENVETTKRIERVSAEPYSRYFAKGTSELWERDFDYNEMSLRSQRAILQRKLERDGYLFLNDVYTALGFERTQAGQTIGWVYNPKNPALANFVDFGLDNMAHEDVRAFRAHEKNAVWLRFNVDGDILNSNMIALAAI